MLKAKDVMTDNVAFVRTDCQLADANQLMEALDIHYLPVLNMANQVVGLISSYQLNLFALGSEELKEFPRRCVGSIVTRDFTTLDEAESISQVALMLLANHCRCVVITDECNRLVGIITCTDLLYLFCQEDVKVQASKVKALDPRLAAA